MTTWVDWHNWTYVVLGQEIVYGGRVRELDFVNRRVTYERDTGHRYDENPHPYGTEEAHRFLYETIEATFDRVWVDPDKSIALGPEAFRALEAGNKPSSFIELTDMDPRDYFGGEVQVMSTYAPHLLPLMRPGEARAEEKPAVEVHRDSDQALDAFRQVQRDIAEGLYPRWEGAALSIWHLGAVEDIGASWSELNPWIAIEVRSILRSRLVDGEHPISGMRPQMEAALLRVASWADRSEVLSRDQAFAFMNQPPDELLAWVRLHLGEALPDPGMSWRGVANDAVDRAFENPAGSPWLAIAIEVFSWLASQKADPDHSDLRMSEMHARVQRIHLASTSPAEREVDRQIILDWFFRHESIAPSEAAICDRDWYKLSRERQREQGRIRKKLHVIDHLYQSREAVPDRIREWLAILPHLRLM